MSKLNRTLFASLLCLAAVLTAGAQTNTNVAAFHTNFVLKVNLSLTAYIQREFPVSSNRVVKVLDIQHFSSRQIVDTIAADIGGGSNDLSGASLLFRSDGLTPDPSFEFLLRKGNQDIVLTNELTFNGASGAFIGSELIGPKGTTNTSNLTIFGFSLNTSKASADLHGLTRLHGASVIFDKQNIAADPLPASFTSSLIGSGLVQGRETIWRGTISASGRKVEVGAGP